MLTEQEKERIRQEEIFRYELRQSLEKSSNNESTRKKVWAFINSAFFLWFLSSIVLGLIGFLYTRSERDFAIEQEKRAKESKLDAEISSRLSYYVKTVLSPLRLEASPDPTEILKAAKSLETPKLTDYPINVIPEYANWSLRSLLWELLQVVPNEEKKEIRYAYDNSILLYTTFLEDAALVSNPDKLREYMQNAPSHIGNMEMVYASLNLERWGKPFAGME